MKTYKFLLVCLLILGLTVGCDESTKFTNENEVENAIINQSDSNKENETEPPMPPAEPPVTSEDEPEDETNNEEDMANLTKEQRTRLRIIAYLNQSVLYAVNANEMDFFKPIPDTAAYDINLFNKNEVKEALMFYGEDELITMTEAESILDEAIRKIQNRNMPVVCVYQPVGVSDRGLNIKILDHFPTEEEQGEYKWYIDYMIGEEPIQDDQIEDTDLWFWITNARPISIIDLRESN